MGVWGAGAFENDEALDWSADLSPDQGWAPVDEALDETTPPGEPTDAEVGMSVIAAAEVVAASRGHAAEDFPETLQAYVQAIGPADMELTGKAAEAVSNVLTAPSELVELWAESDEAEEWNRAVTGLIERLSSPAREHPKHQPGATPEKQVRPGAFICSFCDESIPDDELLALDLKRPGIADGVGRTIYAHFACLNAKLLPGRLVQWWRTPE